MIGVSRLPSHDYPQQCHFTVNEVGEYCTTALKEAGRGKVKGEAMPGGRRKKMKREVPL